MNFLRRLFQRKKRIPRTDITKRFALIGRTGQGSMSRVFRARDTLTGKIVALKILDKEKTKRFEARFPAELNKPTEGEVAVSLKHPHIVTSYEWGMTREGEQFLVMEFVEGVSLSYLVEVQNDVMKSKRLRFMIQLGEALRYFHEQGWIHRDVCPRNVIVTPENQLKLIDFGLVVPNTPPFHAPGNRTGTATYMAPELIKRLRTDQRIDVFSFAVTCFEMYTKRFPWGAAETLETVMQHINNPPVDIRTIVPEIDEQIAETIMKGLAADPDRRWPDVRSMVREFRDVNSRLKAGRAGVPGMSQSTSEVEAVGEGRSRPRSPDRPRRRKKKKRRPE